MIAGNLSNRIMSVPKVDVELENVSMSFTQIRGGLHVLDSINLKVHRGKLITIVGPSGCGKTTLLKIIAGLLKPTDGKVTLDADRVLSGIAYVPQVAALMPWRTARQNACVGLELKTEVTKDDKLSKANLDFVTSMFEEWRLKGFEDSYPNDLSGGMAQRVSLIRSLASRPSMLFCDEPFSAIDFVTRLRLSTEFKRMCKVSAITTILVTHNIEEAIFLGDHVVVMSGRPGRIVSIYEPIFSKGGNDAVTCRTSPEFGKLFNSIWLDLEENHA